MKTTLALLAIGSFSLLAAGPYSGNYYQGQQNGNNGYYQGQQYGNNGYNQGQPNYNNQYSQQQQSPSQNQRYMAQQDPQTSSDTTYISDEDIASNIKEALKSSLFSKGYPDVTYTVYNGVVTLNGTVDSNENRKKLEEKVKYVDGVKSVNDQTTVKK